ncbi:MAG: kinase-like domain-containing protein [Piptocephalis tieghemiana]|nr:MAG: kinase-like domain-containing protein [Piptocephalis tieghemiana]
MDSDDDEEGQAAAEYDPQGGEAMKEAEKRHDQRFHPTTTTIITSISRPLGQAISVDPMTKDPLPSLPSQKMEEKGEEEEEEEEMDDMFADTPPPASTEKKPTSSAPLTTTTITTTKLPQFTTHIPEDDWDDADGYYRTVPGELLDSRYRVHSHLGKGVFSTVVRAHDLSSRKEGQKEEEAPAVAIKIVRRNDTMRRAGLKEAGILHRLAKADPEGRRHVIRLLASFEHRGHLCLVFEAMSYNLRQVLQKYGKGVGLHLHAVRAYAQQAFLALSLLTKVGIVHADIKPDNILVNEGKTNLRVCDLGSAFDPSDPSDLITTPYLVSRFYRAPEIILGLPYDSAIDIWSMGCSLYELFTGRILFPGRTNNHMLRLHMELQGRFAFRSIRRGLYTQDHFDPTDKTFLSRETDRLTNKEVIRPMAITKPTKDLHARLLRRGKGTNSASTTGGTPTGLDDQDPLLPLFVDFLQQCLALSPEKRLTAKQALAHPFLRG